MAGSGGVSMEKFEEYFQRADLDRDGRISGAEAVAFLTGSNLPRQVLAQIWMHADQNQSGFLNRPQFYNALKLVTVAQSKRELTPDIIKAALYGPASAKIPAPQINANATPVVVPNSAALSLPQTGAAPRPTQNFCFRGPVPPVTTVNQQYGIVSSTTGLNQQVRPAHLSAVMNHNFEQAPSTLGMNQQFGQTGQLQPTRNININHKSGLLQSSSTGMNQQFGQAPPGTNMNQQIFSSQGNQIPRPPLPMSTGPVSHLPQAAGSPNVSRDLGETGLPNSSNDWLGGKTGVASTGPATQGSETVASFSMSSVSPNSQILLSTVTSTASNDTKGLTSAENRSATSPVSTGDVFSDLYTSQKISTAPERNISSLSPVSAIVPVTSIPQTSVKPDPFKVLQSSFTKPPNASEAAQTSSLPKSNQLASPSAISSVVQAGAGNSIMEQSQNSWPKMTRAGIQKYAKVFTEVDNDKDGKISGDQARNLFLSWRLPREVLKQVWDLSDQDGDSMLTLREFCIALYLMERYREGSSLPSMLPNSVVLDETLLSLTGPSSANANIGWVPTTGLMPQQGLPGAPPVATAGFRPPVQPTVSQPDESLKFNQKNATGSLLDNSNSNKLINGEVNSLDTDGLKAEENNGKIDDNDKVLLDSREKLEFYRRKMQDLVLYKSRCDNRLNEITERARADKSEAELLEKKYQEKYKQVAEIHSKLTIEEASFREIKGRKMELQEAINKIEQGGSVDGILQVRADRMQSDFEELLKALAASSNKHSIDMKSSALMIELPTGWHPGIPEVAAIWDEEWDKFDDAGLSFDVALPESGKSESGRREDSPPTRSLSPESVLNVATSEELFGEGTEAFDAESVQITDEPKSPIESPWIQTSESPREHPGDHFRKSSDGVSETQRSFDEHTWGNFDNNDDIDSVWGFNIKDSDNGNHEEKYFFGSNDFDASPKRSESPPADSFAKNNFFTYEDSVPGTPPSRAGNSPRYSDVSRDPVFDSFRHDSFSMHDQVPSSDQQNFSRFDSMSSTRGFDHSSNFSFDESDPFGSSGPFKASRGTPG